MKSRRCLLVIIFVCLALLSLGALLAVLTWWQVSPNGSSVSLSQFLGQKINPSDSPTTSPSSLPSMAPSDVPSDIPSDIPSHTPSDTPSLLPSSRPSDRPSTTPSFQPTSSPSVFPSALPTNSPTRLRISSNFAFSLKLYWDDYFWQDEDFDRKWCLECATCDNTTVELNTGLGCRSTAGSDSSFACNQGDQLWVQKCGKGRGNTEFNLIQGDDEADQIKVKGTNLCLERYGARRIILSPCESGKLRQQWVGFQKNTPFELRPIQHLERCITQHHHPKGNELIYTESCHLAHHYDTGFWEAV